MALRKVKEGTSLLTPGIIELTGVADVPDEEVFGPLLNVWRYAHFDEAIRLANNTRLVCRVGWCRRIARSSNSSCWRRGLGSLTGINRSPGQRVLRRLVVSARLATIGPVPGMPPIIAPGRWPVWNLPN